MKKLVTILVIVGFLTATLVPMAVADRRGYYHGHHPRHHGHYRYYHLPADHFWIGLGVGVLTSAIVSGFYNSPPSSGVVYVEPQPVVVHRTPVVVTTPRPTEFGKALPATYGQVTVTPAALNLRSGPGEDYKVTGKVNKGDVLDVIASEPSWFYVRTPEGSYGWVMDQYTRPAQPVG